MPQEKRLGSVEGQRGQDDVVNFEACSCGILCEGGGESKQIFAVVVSEEETACMANYHWCGMLIISISLSDHRPPYHDGVSLAYYLAECNGSAKCNAPAYKWGRRWGEIKSIMEKWLTIAVMVVIVGLQAVHIAATNRKYLLHKFVDDRLGLSYTAYDSLTLAYSYTFGFILAASGATILIYLGLIIAKLVEANLSQKVLEALNFAVALLQFSLAVSVAVNISA